MFVCVVANLVLKRIAPRQMLQQGELLAIYIMVAISCTFAGHDTMQNMFGSIAHPFRFATEENEWQTLFFRYLPAWLTVSDAQSLQGFYEGESTFYTNHNFSSLDKAVAVLGTFFPDYDVHDALHQHTRPEAVGRTGKVGVSDYPTPTTALGRWRHQSPQKSDDVGRIQHRRRHRCD